jgi:dipeptidyl aminopeptidase/acylaminoacyl peptidase
VAGFVDVRNPVWSPDGRHIVFSGYKTVPDRDWWIVPSAGGDPLPLGMRKLGDPIKGPRDWIGNQIVYSDGNIKRISIETNPWRVVGPFEDITSGPAASLNPRAISSPHQPEKSTVVFEQTDRKYYLWELPLDPNRPLASERSMAKLYDRRLRGAMPSASNDGRRLGYLRFNLDGLELRARDLSSGSDRLLVSLKQLPRGRLSPDGSFIAMNAHYANVDQTEISVVDWSTGEIRTLCDKCGLLYEWSSDGKRLIYRTGNPMRFWELDIQSGNRRVILSDEQREMGGAALSQDGRWMALHYAVKEGIRPIFIAPVRSGVAAAKSEWVTLSDRPGQHVRPWWSPDGNTIYYISDSSGHLQILAQRLRPADKHPVGDPIVIFSPPAGRYRLIANPLFGPALLPRSIIFMMAEETSVIWLGQQQ